MYTITFGKDILICDWNANRNEVRCRHWSPTKSGNVEIDEIVFFSDAIGWIWFSEMPVVLSHPHFNIHIYTLYGVIILWRLIWEMINQITFLCPSILLYNKHRNLLNSIIIRKLEIKLISWHLFCKWIPIELKLTHTVHSKINTWIHYDYC